MVRVNPSPIAGPDTAAMIGLVTGNPIPGTPARRIGQCLQIETCAETAPRSGQDSNPRGPGLERIPGFGQQSDGGGSHRILTFWCVQCNKRNVRLLTVKNRSVVAHDTPLAFAMIRLHHTGQFTECACIDQTYKAIDLKV